MMKRTFLWLAAVVFTTSCSHDGLLVEVVNNTRIERDDETIEIAWSEVAKLQGVTPENVVVLNAEKQQVPSQVIFHGEEQAQALIFQSDDVEAMQTKFFTITTGVRKVYEVQVHGRFVPERLDDYAWENQQVAYRLYGPALATSPTEKLVTPGIDVWVKSTEKLVIDEWYARGNYHHNYGDGMDCYKVGPTLGAGASAPLVDEKLYLSGNYATQRTLDNGPLRTSVELTYAPFDVNGVQVALIKYISLDADKRFSRMENIYTGDFEQLPIAAGFARHDVKTTDHTANALMLCEAASDTKTPEIDGDIYLGLILPGADFLPDVDAHALAVKAVKPGEKLVYWAGSGWSRGGIESMDDWIECVEVQTAEILEPLIVTVSK